MRHGCGLGASAAHTRRRLRLYIDPIATSEQNRARGRASSQSDELAPTRWHRIPNNNRQDPEDHLRVTLQNHDCHAVVTKRMTRWTLNPMPDTADAVLRPSRLFRALETFLLTAGAQATIQGLGVSGGLVVVRLL